jgi:hypothetical protein
VLDVEHYLLTVCCSWNFKRLLFRLLHREDENVLFVARATRTDEIPDNFSDSLGGTAERCHIIRLFEGAEIHLVDVDQFFVVHMSNEQIRVTI